MLDNLNLFNLSLSLEIRIMGGKNNYHTLWMVELLSGPDKTEWQLIKIHGHFHSSWSQIAE